MCSLAGWPQVGLWDWVDACLLKAHWASHPSLPSNCTFSSRAVRSDRPSCDNRVRDSFCQRGFQAMSLPEKINKKPSDILITVRLKIIPQHVGRSCPVRIDICVCLCHLTLAVG